MNTKLRKSVPGEGPTPIDVNGRTVTAMPFAGDWLIRGTEQDRLTVVYVIGEGRFVGTHNAWGPEDVADTSAGIAIREALDHFWPGWRERNPADEAVP